MVLPVKKISLLLLFIALNNLLSAQNYYDSSIVSSTYKNIAGNNQPLFIGSEYIDYNHSFTGNPFYESLYFTNGNVVYDGIEHHNVQLFYDILHDEVVIKNYNDTPLILVKEKVSSFSLAGHNFQQVFADSSLQGNKLSGFIDVLYNGEIKFVAKRKKDIVEKTVGQSIETYFTQTNDYFIFKNNMYYRADNKRSALNILEDKKTQLIKFARQHKLNFKSDKEASLAKMVEYYDGLNNTK